MTPIEKVRSYAHRYLGGAYIIDAGFAKWMVSGTKTQKAKIARKAILEGMYIQTVDEYPNGELARQMFLTY